jgi:uncharacterized protein YecE (DUF72 family)
MVVRVGMLWIGCSGFAVPPTKYFREFSGVELAETALGVPGPALVRRWKREAPSGFVFTALAPRGWCAGDFGAAPDGETGWAGFVPVARELGVSIAVLTSPDLPFDKRHAAAARERLTHLAMDDSLTLVWDPPARWSLAEAIPVVDRLRVTLARDPARHPPVEQSALAYYRLPGPAGHKSRYEQAGVDLTLRCLRETRAETIICVFANADMYADARRIQSELG